MFPHYNRRPALAPAHGIRTPGSDRILRLNAAHGTPNSDTRGYHETITRAYLVLLARFARANADLDGAGLAQTLLSSPLAERDALFNYYSKDRLMSVAARRDWVEPDLCALDESSA